MNETYGIKEKWSYKLYDIDKKDNTFHLGQCYDDHFAYLISCRECGESKLNVGVGHCITIIRCPNCEWEAVIHDG